MSEAEKIKRLNYKKNRKKWIFIQSVVLIVLAILIAVSSTIYTAMNRTYYIDYTENSEVNYKVQITPGSQYGTEWLEPGQSYVASIVENVLADFKYKLEMHTVSDVYYDATYNITASVIVMDNTTDVSIYAPSYTVVTDTKLAQNSDSLVINKEIAIDYDYYNSIAKSFITTYGLTDTTSTLIVSMNVGVNGSSDEFAASSENEHTVSISIPLNERTFVIETNSSVSSQDKVLAINGGAGIGFYKTSAIVLSVVFALLALVLVAFIFLTRNEDINYTIKVQRIVSAYKSFIQKVIGGFATKGYQLVKIASFDEMLAIRDTIQSPILMSENDDQTRTCFYIPTNTKLLYMFDIKVDNYDEIYGTEDETEDTADDETVVEDAPVEVVVDAPVEEAPVEAVVDAPVEESPVEAVVDAPVEEAPALEVVEEVVEEAIAEDNYETIDPTFLPTNVDELPILIIDDNDEDEEEEITTDDEDAFDAPLDDEDADLIRYGAKYDYSFEAKLALATDETKTFYRQIASFAKSYGVKVARSWKRERVYKGRNLFALIVFRGTKLAITLALNPAEMDAKYHAQDVSMYKKYDRTPALMRITSPRKVAQAIELLTALFEGAGIKDKALGIVVPHIEHKSKKTLILENLIKTEVDPHTLEDTVPAPVVVETPEEVIEAPAADAPAEDAPVEVVIDAPVEEIAEECVTDNLDALPDLVPPDEDENEDDTPIEDDEDAFDVLDEDDNTHDYGAKYDYSFEAKLALATDETKTFYRQIASFAKSYGVKVARSWKRERVYKGRNLFALLVFRGTKLAIALALNPAEMDAKYHAQDVSMYKKYNRTPALMRITSPRKVAQAIELLTALFEGAGIKDKALGIVVPHIEHKSKKTLILENLIKTEVDPHSLIDVHTHITLLTEPDEDLTVEVIERALTAPTVELENIDFVDEVDEVYEETVEHPGVDVIGVVWPERAHKNKIYRYDPNGEVLEDGDIVLVPTSDRHRGREIVRKAAVAHGNHKVDPDTLKHPLKKIIAIVKRKLEDVLSGT